MIKKIEEEKARGERGEGESCQARMIKGKLGRLDREGGEERMEGYTSGWYTASPMRRWSNNSNTSWRKWIINGNRRRV